MKKDNRYNRHRAETRYFGPEVVSESLGRRLLNAKVVLLRHPEILRHKWVELQLVQVAAAPPSVGARYSTAPRVRTFL
jgi:hypothetical protein